MMRTFRLLYVGLAIFLLINSAYADRKYFGRSYLANTLPANSLEFELWNSGRIGKDVGLFYRFEPRFEFEYGITDRFTGSLYFNFDQTTSSSPVYPSEPMNMESSSLELRYRLSNPGEYFIDPALYFEFGYGGSNISYESKLLFSKRINQFICVLNLTGEIERDVIQSSHQSAFEITGGLMYEVSPKIAFGLEFRNDHEFENIFERHEHTAWFAGPTINVLTEKFYLTFNLIKQFAGSPATSGNLNLSSYENYEFRAIVGIGI